MTPTDRKLSVLIPVYNEEKTVEAVTRKVLALGDLVKEVVIVDDGPTDGTAGVVEDLAKQEPSVRFLRIRGRPPRSATPYPGRPAR
jgi:glycosyltransferase involved in cell wall biosynthesis